jgi:hypothetical protein
MIFIDIEFLIIPDYEMISICFKTNLLFFSFKKILQTLVVTVKFFFFFYHHIYSMIQNCLNRFIRDYKFKLI